MLPGLALACLNDRDTLGNELKGKPDVQRALTGRFDRYPNLYYQMRIDRLRAKPSLSPDELDDLAVALARIGQNEDAIAAIRRKNAIKGLTTEQRYRSEANLGTFLVHDWVHRGARKQDLSELKEGEGHIANAMALKPNAHFGREATQLEVIRYLIQERSGTFKGKDADTLGMWLTDHQKPSDAIQGLAGLITLGAAWESLDVAAALHYLLEMRHQRASAALARLRYDELAASGKRPLTEEAPGDLETGFPKYISKTGEPSVEERFAFLRKEANARDVAMAAYLSARLTAGRHPDTDPSFWSEWKEPPMPVLPTKIPPPWLEYWNAPRIGAVVAMVLAAVGGIVFLRARRV